MRRILAFILIATLFVGVAYAADRDEFRRSIFEDGADNEVHMQYGNTGSAHMAEWFDGTVDGGTLIMRLYQLGTLATLEAIHGIYLNYTIAGGIGSGIALFGLPEVSLDPPTPITNMGYVYSKNVSGTSAPFWMGDNGIPHNLVLGGGSAPATLITNSFNGAIIETIDIDITESGGTVSLELQADGGGNLTLLFSTGSETFVAPPATVALTVGSDTSPTLNYVYILQSDSTLTANTTGFPSAEHAPVATVLVQSAATVAAKEPYKVHAHTDHISDSNDQGHQTHLGEWIRSQHATWVSGAVPTLTITVVGGSDTVIFTSTSGVAQQLHAHTFPAFTGTPDMYIVNDNTTPFTILTDLNGLTADSTGAALSNNDRLTIVVWGVVSEDTDQCKLMVNLPSGVYNTNAGALADENRFTSFAIPADFKGTGFLIASYTLKYQTADSGTFTLVSGGDRDLRGLLPSIIAGGGITGAVEFADNVFRILDDTDPTKEIAFQASGISTATTRTLTVPDANGTIMLNLVEDTTPQLGGPLDTDGENIQLNDNLLQGDNTKQAVRIDGNLNEITDIYLGYDDTYYFILFSAAGAADPTSNDARGFRWTTDDLESNKSGTWENVAAGGGGSGGNEYIPFEMRLGIPKLNLNIVDLRQGMDTTNWHSYAKRTAISGTDTQSNLWLAVQLPSDFDSFYNGTNIWIQVYSNDRANNTITLSVYDDTGDVDDGVNAADIEPGSDATWAEASDQITETDANYAAGDWIFLEVIVVLDTNDYYYIGEGHIRYTKS